MARTVEVLQSDINDVVADVVAIPIGCTLKPVRRVAQAIFEGPRSQAAVTHLASLLRKEPDGVKPASVVVFPKGTHARGGRVAIVAVHDDRPTSDPSTIEPDTNRIRHAARRVFEACETTREKSVALAPLGGIDMMAEDAVAIAADALVEHWRTHPLSELERVVFIERTASRTQALVDVVVARFPGALVTVRDDDATTVIVPAAVVANALAMKSVSERPALTVPPPEKPPEIVAPFGLSTTKKHSTRLAFDSWRASCGGSPIPAGCVGVAFRFASSTGTHLVAIRVHASNIQSAWLDGKPLADGRAYLAMGEHVLAVECGPGTFAAVVDAAVGSTRERTPAKVRAVADGAVSASPIASAGGAWTALDGGGASSGNSKFEPVLTSSTEPLPDWTEQRGVWLPDGTRFVRFVFPIVFEANT